MLQYCPTEVVLMSRTLLSGGVVDERNQTPKQAARPHGYYAIRSLFIKIMCNFACLDIITENMELIKKTEESNEERTALGILLTISFCHLLDDTMHSMLPAIYPMLKSEFGLSFFQVGIITLVLQLTSSIIQP